MFSKVAKLFRRFTVSKTKTKGIKPAQATEAKPDAIPKTDTIVMIVTDGALDPGAPPPYELEELPTDNNEPSGPWQCTLHVAHIPEAHRGKARQDGPIIPDGFWGYVRAHRQNPTRDYALPNVVHDNTCSQNRTRYHIMSVPTMPWERATRPKLKKNRAPEEQDKTLLTVPSRSSKRKTRKESKRRAKSITATTSSTVTTSSRCSPFDEVEHDRAYLDAAMSVIFPDCPRGQWGEEEELQLLGMLLDASPNDLDNLDLVLNRRDGNSTDIRGFAAFACLSPILENVGEEVGVEVEGKEKDGEESGGGVDGVLNPEWQVGGGSKMCGWWRTGGNGLATQVSS